MAFRIPVAYSARWLYQRLKCVSMKNQAEEIVNQNRQMGVFGRVILGLAVIEVAHSLPAQGKPGFISVGYRKNQTRQTASVLDAKPDEVVEPETKGEETKETPGFVSSWFESFSEKEREELEVHTEDEALLREIDRLCEKEDFETALKVLNNTRGDTPEHLWRRGQINFEIAKDMPHNKERERLIIEGHESLVRAIEMDENNFLAHYWMSPLVHARAEIDGLVATAHVATAMEKHLAALVRIRPEDPKSHFSYGMWYYAIAEISWIERLGALAIGAGLPHCTFAQALECFLKAEEASPNHSLHNTMMVGKSYLALKDYENAQLYLSKVVSMPARKNKDMKVQEESIELLKQIEKHKKHQ